MEVSFEGTYDRARLVDGLRAMMAAQRGVFMAILAVYGALVVLLGVTGLLSPGGPNAGLVVVVVVVGGVLLGIRPLTIRLQAARFGAAPLYQSPQRGRAGEEGIELRSALVHARTRWEAYTHHRLTDSVAVLYQSQATATIVPRGFFATTAEWDAFCALVRRRVPSTPRPAAAPGPVLTGPDPIDDGPPFTPTGPGRSSWLDGLGDPDRG
jgi:hypothetical protein